MQTMRLKSTTKTTAMRMRAALLQLWRNWTVWARRASERRAVLLRQLLLLLLQRLPLVLHQHKRLPLANELLVPLLWTLALLQLAWLLQLSQSLSLEVSEGGKHLKLMPQRQDGRYDQLPTLPPLLLLVRLLQALLPLAALPAMPASTRIMKLMQQLLFLSAARPLRRHRPSDNAELPL